MRKPSEPRDYRAVRRAGPLQRPENALVAVGRAKRSQDSRVRVVLSEVLAVLARRHEERRGREPEGRDALAEELRPDGARPPVVREGFGRAPETVPAELVAE